MQNENYTLLCDFYELTMSNGYFKLGRGKEITYFDVFFRTVPDGAGYAIFAGLEQFIDYIKNLHFTEEDIAMLRAKGQFDEEFLEFLRTFRFTGDIYAMKEGTPIFPGEPIVTVRAPAIEAQLIETFALLTLNHQSLIATKASRIVRAADGRAVAEFGSRRAQGTAGAILGARASYIGGCAGTACTLAERDYGIPATGTMAHSWVQMFDDEYTAFRTYCELYPDNVTLLIDTYDAIGSGVPNAIRAIKEVLLPRGCKKYAVRLDSGDLAYLTKKIRKMLDEAGLPDCRITATNSLDENIIKTLLSQGAKIDAFGVGERLICSASNPVFGGVYKLVAVENADGTIRPKIKISENVEKITNPGYKKPYRVFDKETGMMIADYIALADEVLDENEPLLLFDPVNTWKHKTVENYRLECLHIPVFLGGECVYESPNVHEIRDYCREQLSLLWDEVKRFDNPHRYYVDLSDNLWTLKQEMLRGRR
ncbi:MAG: nicotinate phosphoribosyltransferase [Ruminococcaceae bacterium]|nr:nicotinate phosphoribosyltransferase [Oscillospiraceae bacterium]